MTPSITRSSYRLLLSVLVPILIGVTISLRKVYFRRVRVAPFDRCTRRFGQIITMALVIYD
jgi:hypothetical protein